MNYSIIVYILGWVLTVESALMILPCVVALIYSEKAIYSFLITMIVSLVVGLLLIRKKPKNTKFYAREGFATVALSWILMSVVGSIPFVISGDIPSFISALFETVSGFTTTGSSNLREVESLSYASLFWRSETHWIGGMGVLVFLLTIIPLAGGQSIQLMRAESPGPTVDKFRPKLRQMAAILYIIYLVMTVIETILLLFGGMGLFDAVTTAMSTAGTGGFSVRNAGINAYQSPYIEVVIAVFMMLFGVNFTLYYALLTKKFKETLKNSELIGYIAIMLGATAVVTVNVYKLFPTLKDALRNAFFTVSSTMSSTGFCTADFDKWPEFSRLLIVILMFFGACSGSTGGGIKIIRILILFKSAFRDITHTIRPNSVSSIRINGKRVSDETTKSVLSYFVIEMAVVAVSAILLSINGFDLTTTVTSVITCLHNIGPGLNMVGPTGNFADYSVFSKLILIFDMLAGRLELMPLMVLFSPATWKKY